MPEGRAQDYRGLLQFTLITNFFYVNYRRLHYAKTFYTTSSHQYGIEGSGCHLWYVARGIWKAVDFVVRDLIDKYRKMGIGSGQK